MPDRAAIVTGASSGIGLAIAQVLAEEGHALTINARRPDKLDNEAVDLLRAAGAEHRNALVVNLASISAKKGRAWLSVYSATKAGLVAFTEAMNEELGADGVKSVALAPGWVDTPMTDFIKEQVKPEEMITTRDVAEAVRFLLRLSPNCVIGEIVFQRPGEAL
jgi:NAD(P)-dependent dehydrogenase (short-subunit alcohol dehydrogenase family)